MRKTCIALCAAAFALSGCFGSGTDVSRLFDAGRSAISAATASDKVVLEETGKARSEMDAQNAVLPPGNAYEQRIYRLAGTSVNGQPLSYRIYRDDSMGAWSFPDGSVRVTTGLMDGLNDDELRFAVGHEIGHVALGHSLDMVRTAYLTQAAKQAGGAFNPTAATIIDKGAGEMARVIAHAQFSQAQEHSADEYGMKFLKSQGGNPGAAITAMKKLGDSGGGFFDSHPTNDERMRKLRLLQNDASY